MGLRYQRDSVTKKMKKLSITINYKVLSASCKQ